jgi:hypothetical protein
MNIRNYYGWHEMEKLHKLLAEGWREFATKYMSLNSRPTSVKCGNPKIGQVDWSKISKS